MLIRRLGSYSLAFVSLAAIIFTASACHADDGAKKLFRSKCSTCHSYKLVNAHKNASVDDWNAIINRMKNHGLKLTADEQNTIAQYLANTVKKK